jgi:hypothetical protein
VPSSAENGPPSDNRHRSNAYSKWSLLGDGSHSEANTFPSDLEACTRATQDDVDLKC